MDEGSLSAEQGLVLLRVARHALEAHFAAASPSPPLPTTWDTRLDEPGGAFVTLKERCAESAEPRLRGCIGTFDAEWPLAETVSRMAIAAATRDPRFARIEADELAALVIEVSVLSPRRRIAQDQLETIVPGRHGLCVRRGAQHGVLLPQVALEYGWDRETFLQQTCRKAGLAPDAWRAVDTAIEIFTAQIFSEICAPAEEQARRG